MAIDKLGQLIAERELDLVMEDGVSVQKVLVKIGKPKKVSKSSHYLCHFQIIGIGNEEIRYGIGSDGMQALILALTKIGSHLYTSDESRAKNLKWLGSPNLGFPAFISQYPSDLVPEPDGLLLL